MSPRLAFKLLIVLAVMLFMVMMGMSNNDMVTFKLNPLKYVSNPLPTALMYFTFFGVGVFVGGVLVLGPGKSGSSSSSSGEKKK